MEAKHLPRISKGYRYVYAPESPSANRSGSYKGYVLEHRLVMEKNLGRALNSGEHIHHKDFNTLNNTIDNLLLLTNSEHTRLHHLLKGHTVPKEELCDERRVRRHLSSSYRRCKDCGRILTVKEDSISPISRCVKCAAIKMRKVERPSRESLIQLLTGSTFRQVGKQLGVSDKTIRKWADGYAINYKTLICRPKPLAWVVECLQKKEIRERNRQAIKEWHKKNLSSSCRAVVCLSKSGEVIRKYTKLSDASKDGFLDSPIARCCRGKLKTYKGFVWRYEEDLMGR